MKNFGENDIVFARATSMGRELFNLRLSGIASIESVFDVIRREGAGLMGLVILTVRNVTQGWTQTGSYRVTA